VSLRTTSSRVEGGREERVHTLRTCSKNREGRKRRNGGKEAGGELRLGRNVDETNARTGSTDNSQSTFLTLQHLA